MSKTRHIQTNATRLRQIRHVQDKCKTNPLVKTRYGFVYNILTCQDVVDKSVWPGHCRTCLRQIHSFQCSLTTACLRQVYSVQPIAASILSCDWCPFSSSLRRELPSLARDNCKRRAMFIARLQMTSSPDRMTLFLSSISLNKKLS